MSQALTLPAVAVSRYDQPEVIATIKQTVAKGATDAQLQMFLHVCKRTGLDPFLKEIWFVAEKGIIMAGRDGYLRAANEDPNFDGMETRVERDSNNIPVKATCTVWRKDRSHPIICEAYYSEYKKAAPVWNQYPSAMISKVAEVLALKRSFSINGVVTEEEIGFDGSGSKAAAQEVADRKIREIHERRAAEAAARAIPEVTYEPVHEDEAPTQLEVQLESSLKQPQKSNGLNAYQIKAAQMFRPLHEKYVELSQEKRYRAQLKSFGVEKSIHFDLSTLGGKSQAERCLATMIADLNELEERLAPKASDIDVEAR